MKISYLYGACQQHDAISDAIANEIRVLAAAGHDARLYAFRCDHADLPFEPVHELGHVALSRHFQGSDLVVSHFGIYHPLFDLLAVTPRHARRLAVFHNITPKAFVGREHHGLIDRSFAQLSNMQWADHVVCVSHTNLAVLRNAGIETPASVMPLCVASTLTPPKTKPSHADDVVRIVYVGRLVASKGPMEVLDGVQALLAADSRRKVQLDMIGNLHYSDPKLVAEVQQRMEAMHRRHATQAAFRLHGNASESLKQSILREADVFVLPTRHEGFCVPIIEALSTGCLVVTYDNSNTPAVCGSLGKLVPTGDVDALTSAMLDAAATVSSHAWREGDGAGSYLSYASACVEHTGQFSPQKRNPAFLRFVERWMAQDKHNKNHATP